MQQKLECDPLRWLSWWWNSREQCVNLEEGSEALMEGAWALDGLKAENAAHILLQSLFVSDFMGFFLNASENGAANPNQELCFFWESWNADPWNIYKVCSVIFDSTWTIVHQAPLWNFSGKNPGVGCHFLLQGIFLTQGSSPRLLCLPHWQTNSLPLRHLYIHVTRCQISYW